MRHAFAQSPALGRRVSDEFTVPLCRGHHREVHRCMILETFRHGLRTAEVTRLKWDPVDFNRGELHVARV
jgi:hypothetical protein